MVDLGYIVVSRLPVFRSDVRCWLCRDLIDQTWPNFIDAFTTTHQEPRKTNALVDEIGYQSANVMVSQIASQVVQELRSNANLPPGVPFTHEAPVKTPTPAYPATHTPLALATGTTATDPAMATMFSTIQTNMEAMRLQLDNANYYGYVDRNRGRGGR